jgi:hypothetical protein
MDASNLPPAARACPRRTIVIHAARLFGLVAAGSFVCVALCFAGPSGVKDASIATARVGATELLRAAEMWRGTHNSGGCPTLEQLLQDKAIDPQSKLTDPWGTPYLITCEDETIVTSLGPDKKPSKDDIVVHTYVRDGGPGRGAGENAGGPLSR